MHNPESVLENEMLKIPWGLEIQTQHLTSTKLPDQIIVNKKREPGEYWTLPSWQTTEWK